MSRRFHLATRKGLFTVERGVSAWSIAQISFPGDNCTLVLHDRRSGELFAALSLGHFGAKLHRSRDAGANWTEISAPKYPLRPQGYVPRKPAEGEAAEWSLKLIWALETGGPNEAGVLWCGTLPGGLFRSEDGGESWNLNRPLWDDPRREEWFGGGYDQPGIHSICVDPRDPRHVIVGVSCGGVWTTRDGGTSWSLNADGMRAEYMPPERQFDPNIQDPHLLVQCRGNPDALWVQHHNGIFRSLDAARSWQEIPGVKPAAFGFTVAVHPEDCETAWFVPAIRDDRRYPVDGALVVNRTRDGGRTFEALRSGLPQRHSYDLVYRHALDVDESGDCLVFGTTTGSLWLSENGGDSWMAIASHLPPIYGVRFEK